MELASWAEVLHLWGTQPGDSRPKQLKHLVRRGIPEALRGEVWLRLADCSADTSVMDAYRVLITKECSADPVIMRDIHRTFPAHVFCKDSGGLGQEATVHADGRARFSAAPSRRSCPTGFVHIVSSCCL